MERITLHDKSFQLLLNEYEIKKRIEEIALQINADYEGKSLTLLVMLKGAFCFAAQLMPLIQVPCSISFMRASSYKGLYSSQEVSLQMGVTKEEIFEKEILIIEDIIDSGNTLFHLIPQIKTWKPTSLRVATLLSKPKALTKAVEAHYVGFEINNEFVVGYGLDYNELGRNLTSIYQLSE